MSVDILSRIQFGLTVSFHFLFPPMSIGLGLVLVPNVYATVFSGFYDAFMLLLVALIFRAVAIEFRSQRPDRVIRGSFSRV